MTQNVKNRRASSIAAVLLLAGFGLLPLASACSSTEKGPANTESGAGAGGCGAADCEASSGRFTPCSGSQECDEAHGFSCIDAECTYRCETHADCVEVGHCEPRVVDGERAAYCVRDDIPPTPGKLYTACPKGSECSEPALCVGAGVGDLDAYCTIDCQSDDDCRAGYFCGTVSRAPCEDACDAKGQPSDPRCAPADQIGSGKPYRCGDFGVERRVCRQREFCATCNTDADCLAVANQVCAKDASGEKICTRPCDTDARSCPWGNAAECGYFDDDLGEATCSHRFGSCHGKGEVCEPCRDNGDCPGGVCISSPFTGERWCVNLSTKCECPNGPDATGTCADGGCPASPGGLVIQCVGDPQSSLAGVCYGSISSSQAQLGASPQTGCWSAN